MLVTGEARLGCWQHASWLVTYTWECQAGVLQRRMEDGHLLAVLESHMSVAQQSILRRGAEKAYQDWFVTGHPNWRIWDHMTYDLLVQGVHAQVNVRHLGHLSALPLCHCVHALTAIHVNKGALHYIGASSFAPLRCHATCSKCLHIL